MKVHELAALRWMNAKDLAKELGLKSHLSIIPDEMLAKLDIPKRAEKAVMTEATPDLTDVKAIVTEQKEDDAPLVIQKKVADVPREVMRIHVRSYGKNSPYWNLVKGTGA